MFAQRAHRAEFRFSRHSRARKKQEKNPTNTKYITEYRAWRGGARAKAASSAGVHAAARPQQEELASVSGGDRGQQTAMPIWGSPHPCQQDPQTARSF